MLVNTKAKKGNIFLKCEAGGGGGGTIGLSFGIDSMSAYHGCFVITTVKPASEVTVHL